MDNFEIGAEYENRIGNYTVLEINDSKMLVKYKDGTTAELSVRIQHRIWENIVTERESEQVLTPRRRKKKVGDRTHFYIKPTSMMTVEELSTSSKPEGVPAIGKWLTTIRRGDRLLYYAQETHVFFAVVTITGPGKKPKQRGRSKKKGNAILYFPVDVDAYVIDLKKAVLASTVELESQPKFMNVLSESDDYLEINEDEFELLAEMLTEVSEEDKEDAPAQAKEDEDFDA
jgi:hypothetical protein